jgi:hypothetical protein
MINHALKIDMSKIEILNKFIKELQNFLQEKALEASKQKEEQNRKIKVSPRKACHSVSTALLQ